VNITRSLRKWGHRVVTIRKRHRKVAWVRQQNVAEPDPLPDFGLFAIIPTFCEVDIVAASVSNALAQGCDAVYLVDNDSPDDTRDAAEAAGAEIAEIWSSEHQDPKSQKARLHRHASRITEASGHAHAWWLIVDADEFPKGPNGLTVRQYLASLDRSHRIVGARFFTHLPNAEPAYAPGSALHPAEFQPLCYPHPGRYCRDKHYKHLLLRYDRGGRELRLGGGQHRIDPDCGSGVLAVEPTDSLIVQHFQWRCEEDTRRRLGYLRSRLTKRRLNGLSMLRRLETIDAVYSRDWAHVYNDSTRTLGVELRRFDELVPAAEATLPRWYPDDDVSIGVA
jgi:hypothetical protein